MRACWSWARLLIADHSRCIVHIAAQPFRVGALVDGAVRWHVPDFFLLHSDGSVTVVNVKPAERLADPKIAFSLGWAERVFLTHGWRHEVWSSADPVYLEKLHFLSAFRRPGQVPEDLAEAVCSVCRAGGTSIADVVATGGLGPAEPVRAAVLQLCGNSGCRRICTGISMPTCC